MDRRAIFFAAAAVACALLVPATDAALRWVPVVTAACYAVLAVLSWLDWWSRRREHVEERGTPR